VYGVRLWSRQTARTNRIACRGQEGGYQLQIDYLHCLSFLRFCRNFVNVTMYPQHNNNKNNNNNDDKEIPQNKK
jgi:hypothetical protein